MPIMSLVLSVLILAAVAQPPRTPREPVIEAFHGEQIVDDYRWLESWDDPRTPAWSEAQNAYARSVLDSLPSRDEISTRITRLLSHESPSYSGIVVRSGRLFALKSIPPKQQAILVVLDSIDDPATERTLIDPNSIDPSGGLTIDWFVPSFDASMVAVSMSRNGTEAGDAHVIAVETATERHGDLVPRVNSGTAGGSLAWSADGSGFWYTSHPAPGTVPDGDLGFLQRIYYHTLGADPESDPYVLGREFPRIAESSLESNEKGSLLDLVQKGDGGEFELHLLGGPGGEWKRVAGYEDRIVGARFGPDGSLWLLSRKDAGLGKILMLRAGESDLVQARVVVPEGAASIASFELTEHGIWVVEEVGGPMQLHRYDARGRDLGSIPILPISSVGQVVRTGKDDEVFFSNQSYIEPEAWYRVTSDGQVQKTPLAETSPVALSFVEVSRIWATSKDGTKIPMTVMEPRGTKHDGNNPALLTGYGGFDISLSPGYSRVSPVWLEQGGILAIANLRGGGEFGEPWHRAGARTRKQNVFDDFIACAETLVSLGYTSPARLAIEGGSNGGLLMGAVMTQRPDLFRAVVARVGYFDMLRYETKPNGVFNNTEYGTIADPEEYLALKSYSPYHRVLDGVRYPPVLLLTGANDPRVDPMHSRKMTARLQAAGATAYLRTSGSTGHGGGTPLSEEISEEVDVYSFLFEELGVTYRPVAE